MRWGRPRARVKPLKFQTQTLPRKACAAVEPAASLPPPSRGGVSATRPPPALAFPQPHARLIAVRELDAGGYEGGADIRQNVMVRRSGLSLKISDSLCRNLARLGKLVLGPLEKRACSSTLGGGTRHFFSTVT